MSERESPSEREREVVERALANEEFMRQLRESQAAVERGERAIPGKLVREAARRRRE